MKLFGYVLLMSFSGSVLLSAKTNQSVQEFVIAPRTTLKKKMSSAALKEQIGQLTKRAFNQTTELVHGLGDLGCCLSGRQQQTTELNNKDIAACTFAVGTMQKDIASLQKKYSSIVEKLVENDKPFKKASKANLKKTNDVLGHAHQQLALCAKEVARVRAAFKKTEGVSAAVLQKQAQRLHQQHIVLSGLLGAMAIDDCLKTT